MGAGATTPIRDQLESIPADAADLHGKEACVAEVKRIRQALSEWKAEENRLEEEKKEIADRRANGKVRLIYEQYQDLFDLADGAISINAVDEEYCLTDIMPGATLELSTISPQDRIEREIAGIPSPFVEKIDGVWNFLYTYDADSGRMPNTYYIIVFQDPSQREADLARTRAKMAAMEIPSDKRVEGCSCREGNPCTEVNKYYCLDWNNRFAVALANSSAKQKKSVLGM